MVMEHVFFTKYECMYCKENMTIKDNNFLICNCICCNNCITNYLTTQIKNGKHTLKLCSNCDKIATTYTIEKYVSDELITQYLDSIHKHESYKYCSYGHDKKCKSLFTKTVYFVKCKYEFRCIVCNEEIDNKFKHSYEHKCKNDHDNAILTKIKYSSTQPCPTCFMLIDKIDGCDKVQCTNCNKIFKWSVEPVKQPQQPGPITKLGPRIPLEQERQRHPETIIYEQKQKEKETDFYRREKEREDKHYQEIQKGCSIM